MSKYIINRNGERIRLLNPAERGRKYANELHTKTEAFSGVPLRKTQLSFRSGYLKSRSDSAKVFKKTNPYYIAKSKRKPYKTSAKRYKSFSPFKRVNKVYKRVSPRYGSSFRPM